MREAELLEPLVPSVRANLEHRHSYVRRNAVLCVYAIFKHAEHLVPDAPELVFNFLAAEADAACKRNAFIMLVNCMPDRAVEYIGTMLDDVDSLPDTLQHIVIELVRKLARAQPALRGKYIRVVFGLLRAATPAVRFEAAAALLQLSSAPSAVRAAASAYIDVLCTESDTNVKLIVLDRLDAVKRRHPKVMQDLLLDVLRALASPSIDIRRKTLLLSLDLITLKNIDEVVQVLKKEIARTQSKEIEKQGEYRQMLVHAIHTCAVKFPDVAATVVHLLLEFLGDDGASASAADVLQFVREVIETYPDLRGSIVAKLVDQLDQISSSRVLRATLWIIGEYSVSGGEVRGAFDAIHKSVGAPPFVDEPAAAVAAAAAADADAAAAKEAQAPAAPAKKEYTGPRLNADGTYASQSALMPDKPVDAAAASAAASAAAAAAPSLRKLLVSGDFFLGTAVATALGKLTLKLCGDGGGHGMLADAPLSAPERNVAHARTLAVLVGILRLGKSAQVAQQIDGDAAARIYQCIRLLTEDDALLRDIFLHQSRAAFTTMLRDMADHNKRQSALVDGLQQDAKAAAAAAAAAEVVPADACINVRQLRPRGRADEVDDEDAGDLLRATGANEDQARAHESKLNRVVQLTGFSDPIFAEAYVTVHQYDIVLEVSMVNQTGDTLQNVVLELATLGDLKLVERPQYLTIAPGAKHSLKASIKVSSTETGIIFGSIVYDIAGVATEADRNCVILSDIHIDIMDYIQPASCSDARFRAMWAEFEWENKVAVNTTFGDCDSFLEHIVATTHMTCLTPTSSLAGDCGFIAANLYAKSIFGEDCLMNVSIERTSEKRIGGFIRIRSKTQGIALSLGEKVTHNMSRSN
jgi:coatomer subunit beta